MSEFLYNPRGYQLELLQYLFQGGTKGKRAVVVWHRRAGKDITLLNALIYAALYDRVGIYYYFFPTYGQGKKIIWDGIDGNSRKFLSYIPIEAVALDKNGRPKFNETDLQVELTNGSLIQIIGTDRIDSVVGTNPVGCVFSEYSIQKPMAWNLIEPILAENGGWAAFAYTPRGHNHGFDLFEQAGNEPGWFQQRLTVDQTKRDDGTPVISSDYIDSLRRRNTDEDIIQQEYYCSFSGSMQGSYYGKFMQQAQTEGRICSVPWEPRFPVETWWDLGRNDANVIWFVQHIGRDIHAIDYYENTQGGLPHNIKVVREKDYVYSRHILPHDINVVEYGSNTKRIDIARSLGLTNIHVAPKLLLTEGIESVRLMLPRMRFDERKCKRGVVCLQEYHKEFDEDRKCFGDTPVHDWSSNACDAIRVGALLQRPGTEPSKQIRADTGYSIFNDQDTADSNFSVYST